MILKLAIRNIMGAGFRTWLNIFILSLAYFLIIAVQGLFSGWQKEASLQIRKWDIGGGQYWQEKYDPYDPFSLDDSHSPIPAVIKPGISAGRAVPILLAPATIYPQGRMRSIILKGIPHDQKLLQLPTDLLLPEHDQIQAICGGRLATSLDLKEGDLITVRWRNLHGTFDAAELRISGIFHTSVLTIDNNQLWIDLKQLQSMLEMPDQATIITVRDENIRAPLPGFEHKSLHFLLADLEAMIEAKQAGSAILYFILLFMALIAVFDTQILSLFRRRREIGTMMALGMTRLKIIQLFTLEGSLHAILAILVGAVYGIPLLYLASHKGIYIGTAGDDFGLSGITESLYPVYGWKLVLGTILLVLIMVTAVSFFPTRQITRLKPTDALRGKLTRRGEA